MPDPKTGSASKAPSVNFTDWAWSQEILQGPKLVLLALARHADANGCCYPGQERLAEMAGMGDRAVRRHLEWLDETGLISREHRYRHQRRTSDYYRLRADGGTVEVAETSPDLNGGNLPVTSTGSEVVPVDVTGTVPVDLASVPVDLASVPVTSTGNSNKEVELLQRRTSPEGTSPDGAPSRAPASTPEDTGAEQGQLPLGPFGAVSSPPARRNSKAAPKGNGASVATTADPGADISNIRPEKPRKPQTRHGVTVKAILDQWLPTQNPAPVNYHQVRKAVEMCLIAGWTEDKLPQALDDVVASRWSVTPTTLEKALNDRHKPAAMPSRTSTGYQPYRDPEDDSVYFHPMYEPQDASGQ